MSVKKGASNACVDSAGGSQGVGTCKCCGRRLPKGRRKYCSEACHRVWVRDHNRTVRARLLKDGTSQRRCAICDAPLPAGKSRYCSDACYRKGLAATRRSWYESSKGVLEPKRCRICGRELTGGSRRYCSDGCRRIGNSHRALERLHGLPLGSLDAAGGEVAA